MVAGSFFWGGDLVDRSWQFFHRLGNEYLEVCGQIQDSSGSLSATSEFLQAQLAILPSTGFGANKSAHLGGN